MVGTTLRGEVTRMSDPLFKPAEAKRIHIPWHRVQRSRQFWGTLDDIRNALLGTVVAVPQEDATKRPTASPGGSSGTGKRASLEAV